MTDGSIAETWDAEFTAEVFEDAPAESLHSAVWHVGTSPQDFLPVSVQPKTLWRPGRGTDGCCRFGSVDVQLFSGMPLVVQVADVVVGRATIRSVTNERYRKRLHPGVRELEWWIMDCGLPDLIWARLRSWADGTADVLTTGGEVSRFPTKDDAVSWLCEDEFCELEVFNQREFEIGRDLPLIWPPQGASDPDLAHLMLQHWHSEARTWTPARRAG